MIVLFVISSLLFWQDSLWNVNKAGVALAGYDPVSYFQQEPREGKKEFSVRHQGVIFYFTSGENQKAFKTDPSKYLPEYGGYCAYAMGASGEKVEVDPETYKLLEGRLYLFYNAWGNNTLKSWNKKESILKLQADKNWKKISSIEK